MKYRFVAVAHGEEEVDDELLEEGGGGLADALEEGGGELGAVLEVGLLEEGFGGGEGGMKGEGCGMKGCGVCGVEGEFG